MTLSISASVLCGFNSFFGPQGLIILAIILLLFGGKKIPELMRGLGRGINSFKKGMNEFEDEINKPVENNKPADNADKK